MRRLSTTRAERFLRRARASAADRRRTGGCPRGGGEAALRAEREPFERHDARRLGDARLAARASIRAAAVFELTRPEHDDAIVGHVPQRLERPRPLVVVLEQEAIEARAAEHLLRDPIVAARRVEHALVVAAADVDAERDARRGPR